MGDLCAFPTEAKAKRKSHDLAKWFRTMADYIEGDSLERTPFAAMITLSSDDGAEILCSGYANRGADFTHAGFSVRNYALLSPVKPGEAKKENFFPVPRKK